MTDTTAPSATDRLHKLRSMSREEALLGYSTKERRLIHALEQIATGSAHRGPATDLVIAREVAQQALEDIGWPTVRDVKREIAS